LATPITIGTKNAVAAVLLMKALRSETVHMITRTNPFGWGRRAAHGASGQIHETGLRKGTRHDQQTEDHDDGVAAKPGEGAQVGNRPVKTSASRRPSPTTIGRNPVEGKADQANGDDGEE
jgi:hypothetical protein